MYNYAVDNIIAYEHKEIELFIELKGILQIQCYGLMQIV